MAGMAIKMVDAFFKQNGINTDIVDEETLHVGTGFEGSKMDMYFAFEEDSNVHITGLNFIEIPEGRIEQMYKVVNEANDKFAYIKFTVDEEHRQIIARDDAVIQLDSCGGECLELSFRMVKVVESAYPTFMKSIWA